MPSPNGYLTDFSYLVHDRQSWRVTLTHDADSPPWLPGQAGSYTFVWETGPTAAGPWTAAPLTDLGVGCTPQPGNETTVGGVTSTLVRIGDPTPGTGTTADTDYFVRVTVLDPGDVQVDQWVLDTPAHTFAYPTFACQTGTTGETTADVLLGSTAGRVNLGDPCNEDSIVWEIATAPGGPYTASPSEPASSLSPQHTFTGLTEGTTYYWRARFTEQAQTGGEYLVTPECSFTTEEASVATPPFQPLPCDSGGAGGDAVDVEQIVLCDLDAEGNLLGTALAVYEYDPEGNPSGAPTFVDPATGNPYVPQGTLQPCPDAACLPPMQFCQTSTTSGPVEHPGRQYDLTLPIHPGFAVDSLQVDAVTHAAGITWSIFDVDGDTFAADLQAFIQGRMPAGATVTVNNPNSGAAEICGPAQPMTVHIECIRLDQSPPDLIELVYNGGEDLVQNPAYNTNPPTDLSQFQFYYLNRADGPAGEWGPINCTSVANRGWETNDLGGNNRRDFEIWGTGPAGLAAIQNTTPTPRGTPVQEVTADINDTGSGPTIWQTFNVPAPGNFRVQLVHGARDPGETHTIRLSTGDTDDTGPGDIINDVTNPPSVTNSGGPNPWTVLDQTVPLNSGEYTFSFTTTNPVGPNRGGLFTDMRVYIDRPGQRATAVTDDDTCVVTTDETSTNTVCSYWQPQCAGGAVVGWQKVDTGETLTNGEFWAQVPTPGCCLPEAGEGGGTSGALSNMLASDIVCATVGGVQQNAIRVMVTDPSGGTLQVLFLGTDGAPIAPDTWTPGPCTTSRYMADQVLCDDNGPFLRKYVQSLDATNQAQVNSFRDFNLSGGTYTVVGEVRQCGASDTELVELCDVTPGGAIIPFVRVLTYSHTGELLSAEDQDANGAPYAPTGVVTVCSLIDPEQVVLCDDNGPFLRTFLRAGGVPVAVVDTLLDGTTPYAPAGAVVSCGAASTGPVSDSESVVLCDVNAGVPTRFVRTYVRDGDGLVTAVVDNTLAGGTYTPTGAVGACAETGDSESLILCDSAPTPNRFLRTFTYGPTGAVTGFTDTTLAGAAFVPTGAVGVCATVTQADTDFVEEVLCDSQGTAFIRLFRFNSITGVLVSTANTTLAGAAFAPVGAVGICSDCCPQVVADELCTNTGSGRGTAIRANNGTVTLIDSVTGTTITQANIVACPGDDTVVTLTAQGRVVGDADAAWTPGADVAGTLTSVTLTVLSGTATVTDANGTVMAGLPAGYTATWSAEDNNTLTGPQSIDAIGGSTAVVWTQR